ncbi:hypothetical protein CSE6_007_08900 [Comamonas sp. E6]|nr:hypothetical protein CSE6_007_08900 [Comamonas sp. E6]
MNRTVVLFFISVILATVTQARLSGNYRWSDKNPTPNNLVIVPSRNKKTGPGSGLSRRAKGGDWAGIERPPSGGYWAAVQSTSASQAVRAAAALAWLAMATST